MTYKRVDSNQSDIVEGLIAHGCSVQSMASIGKGCADLLVGYLGKNYAMECKDGSKVQSRRELTKAERKWHREWLGQVAVIESLNDALRVVGIVP